MIPETKLQYDGQLTVAFGLNRFDTNWKNRQVEWSSVLDKMKVARVTPETMAAYDVMSKADQDATKDIGGFVGGTLKDGKRGTKTVSWRTMFTLDADFAKEGLFEDFWLTYGCASAAYSTHKDRKGKPRIRICGPYSRPVTPEEHEAISRKLAQGLDMDLFDDTTYQPSRLMYWPSVSSDQKLYFDQYDGPWLDPDKILAEYGVGDQWKDSSYWPESTRVHQARRKQADKQGDPTLKPGVIGAFCRTFTISEAIETFLPDVYTECAAPNRYTYVEGSTAAGLVVYDSDMFAYSNHSTDPTGGRLVNAFDLVRIHKFNHLDTESVLVKEDTPTNKLPSYEAMINYSLANDSVKRTLGEEQLAAAKADFEETFAACAVGEGADPIEWVCKLTRNGNGVCESTPGNFLLVLLNDPNLKGKIMMDDFARRVCITGDLPWRRRAAGTGWADGDDSGLRNYLHKVYKMKGAPIVQDALNELMYHQHFHPVRDYLGGLVWDGVERVDSLLIDYLGAEDNVYTRAVTRRMMLAAVARVIVPGTKFDNMLVIVGGQGIGKSTLIGKIGGQWFSDSIKDINHKDIYQLIQGRWIIEMGELSAIRKADVDSIKHFMSKQVDHFRVPYGKNVGEYPRQGVFWGSSNTDDFLRDDTGGRRFWPVTCRVQPQTKDVFKDLNTDEVKQIWAETMFAYSMGETLVLPPDIAEMATEVQEHHTEENEKKGMVQEYLDTLLPDNWAELDTFQKRSFMNGDFDSTQGTVQRTRICAMEIWIELFGGDIKSLTRGQAIEIRSILNGLKGWEKYTAGTGKLYFGKGIGNQRGYVRSDI